MKQWIIALSLLAASLLFLPGCSDTANNNIALIKSERDVASRDMLISVAHEFYKHHLDQYDMLVLWGAPELSPGHSFYLPIKNDVPGIGYGHTGREFFDDGAEFGSKRLQGIIWLGPDWMARTDTNHGPRSVLGVLAQETGHRFGSSVYFADHAQNEKLSNAILTKDLLHWNFFLDTGGSPMGGNLWTPLGHDLFLASPVNSVKYCSLDLYLMGLLPPEQVEPLKLLSYDNHIDNLSQGGVKLFSVGVTEPMMVKAKIKEISIEQIIEAEGRRDPAVGFTAKHIRQAWIYIYHKPLVSPPPEFWRLVDLQTQWDRFFNKITVGLSSMSTELF